MRTNCSPRWPGSSRLTRAGIALLLAACASLPRSVEPARIRAIRIAPGAARVCPGETIRAAYTAVLDDGTTRPLEGTALGLLSRQGDGVEPADHGAWDTDPDPLVSAMTGFHLRAWLTANPSVAAETTVVPAYTCAQRQFRLSGSSTGNGPDVTVRIAQLHTPFADSVVVVAIEAANRKPAHALLRPADLTPGALKVLSVGSPGRPGVAGRSWYNTPECNNGEDGTDGTDGTPGADGGELTVISDGDRAWLKDLVELVSAGGAGGAGGAAGIGGPAGAVRPPAPGQPPCPATRHGRNGRPGRAGAPGVPGPRPKRLDSTLSLLWFGSQTFEDPKTSKALSAMLNYTLHPRP
jgi:hypothetical protein